MGSKEDSLGIGSFEEIYKQYYSGVAATVHKFKFTNGAADDIIQDNLHSSWKT